MAKSKQYKDTLAMSGSELYKLLDDGENEKAVQSYVATEQMSKKSMGEQKYLAWKQVNKYYQYPAANSTQHMEHVYAYASQIISGKENVNA